MRIIKNNPTHILIHFLLFIYILAGISGTVRAQQSALDSLQRIIVSREDSLSDLIQAQEVLSQSLDRLNKTIFRQKHELKESSNLIKKFQLNQNLKKARQIALKLENDETEIQTIQQRLQTNYRRVIDLYETALQTEMQTLEQNKEVRSKASILSRLSDLESKKKKMQQKLTEHHYTKINEPALEIEPEDNIDRLQLKETIIEDRIARLQKEERQIQAHLKELKSNLSIYADMILFIDNLQQSIDPEQEYFSQERIEQLEDEVQLIKAGILRDLGRLNEIKIEKKNLETKQGVFRHAIRAKLQTPANSGSPDDE